MIRGLPVGGRRSAPRSSPSRSLQFHSLGIMFLPPLREPPPLFPTCFNASPRAASGLTPVLCFPQDLPVPSYSSARIPKLYRTRISYALEFLRYLCRLAKSEDCQTQPRSLYFSPIAPLPRSPPFDSTLPSLLSSYSDLPKCILSMAPPTQWTICSFLFPPNAALYVYVPSPFQAVKNLSCQDLFFPPQSPCGNSNRYFDFALFFFSAFFPLLPQDPPPFPQVF